MHISSDTGERINNETEQCEADQASNALDAIEAFKDTRAAFMRTGLKKLQSVGVNISNAAIDDAMRGLDDVFSDLFHKEWQRLRAIGGDAARSTHVPSASETLFDFMSGIVRTQTAAYGGFGGDMTKQAVEVPFHQIFNAKE